MQRLGTAGIKASAPAGLNIVAPLGGLYAAEYGEGSSVQYHELILFAGLLRRGTQVGLWVSRIYVDDALAATAGQELWGLPKRLASFEWVSRGRGSELSVREDGALLCRVRLSEPRRRMRLPVTAPVWGRKERALLRFRGSGRARVGLCDGRIEMPPASPLADSGISDGTFLALADLDVKVPAARRSRMA